MTLPLELFDAPGPRTRRRMRIASAAATVLLGGVAGCVIWAFWAHGQLAANRWAVFFDWSVIQFLLVGLANTLICTLASCAIAFPLGLGLALLRCAQRRWVARAATLWIELFRTVPLLLVVYIALALGPSLGVNPPLFWKLTFAIVLCASPVIAEVIRAGIEAVPAGQREAGIAVGLSPRRLTRLIVLPQALRIMAPALVTQVVAVVKDTTLGYAVSFPELLKQSQNLSAFTGDLIQTTLVVSLVYIGLNATLSHLATVCARRRSRG